MKNISVTEVRNALRCPRLFALGRARSAAVQFPVGSSSLGATFHRLAERFAGGVAAPPPSFAALPEQAPPEATGDALRRWLLGLLVDELEANPLLASMPAEVDDLAEALRQLAAHLTARLAGFSGSPSTRLTALVHGGEIEVAAPIEEAGVQIQGRMDALYNGADGVPVVVEYKLTDEQQGELDQAQVALYRLLLRRQSGVEARGVVLRFSPACAETSLEPAQADELERRTLLPLLRRIPSWIDEPGLAPATDRPDLCGNCPVAAPCAETYGDALAPRDVPPANARRPRPDAAGRVTDTTPLLPSAGAAPDLDGQQEAEEVGARIVEELRRLGVSVEIQEKQVGASRIKLGLRVLRGTLKKLDSAVAEVRVTLGIAGLDYEKPSYSRAFVVPRGRPRPVLLPPLLAAERGWMAGRPGRFLVGEQPDGRTLRVDLSDPATAHLLIGGQAGSGKSSLLLAIATGLVQFHGPDAVQLSLVDPKRVTFSPSFRGAIGAHLDGPVLYSAEDALPLLAQLIDEMERRYELLERAGVQDLQDYNEQSEPGGRLARRVVLVDEFADLAVSGASKEFFSSMDRLGAKARAAGIHLILATQRPDRETVPSRLKANLGGKIALRVASAVNSRIILDQKGAEELLGRGDLLADLGRGVVRAQAAVVA